jgi:hypothetical protein
MLFFITTTGLLSCHAFTSLFSQPTRPGPICRGAGNVPAFTSRHKLVALLAVAAITSFLVKKQSSISVAPFVVGETALLLFQTVLS